MLNNLMAYLTVTFMGIKEREEGQTLVEYALILAVVSVLIVGSLALLRGGIENTFNDVITAL